MEEVEGDLMIQSLHRPVERHSRLQLVPASVDAMDCAAVFDATA
jgi:hypothetical protein